mmetsp:Transcript_54914/g.80573  ORF Transcript_54914/g.80573 Transcript_54914/m.80573 type:complete len:239 (+) Transcript_54914:726-1442(+)
MHILLEFWCHFHRRAHFFPAHKFSHKRCVFVHAIELRFRKPVTVAVVEVRVRQFGVHEEKRVRAVKSQTVHKVAERAFHRDYIDLVHVLRGPFDGGLAPRIFRARIVPDDGLNDSIDIWVQFKHMEIVLVVDVCAASRVAGVGRVVCGHERVLHAVLHVLKPGPQLLLGQVELVVPVATEPDKDQVDIYRDCDVGLREQAVVASHVAALDPPFLGRALFGRHVLQLLCNLRYFAERQI